MQHQDHYLKKNLRTHLPSKSRDWIKTLTLMVIFALFGILSFMSFDSVLPFLAGRQMQEISELREQNLALQTEVTRLKNIPKESENPSSLKMNELFQRVNIIEQNQNVLIDALKGQQSIKYKRTSIDGLKHNKQPDSTKLALMNDRLHEIENAHISIAKMMTERSESNAQMLTMMLASVSTQLVPKQLLGKPQPGGKNNVGGPFIPLINDKSQQTSLKQEFPEVLSTALDTMQEHARLYKTLINLPMARPLMGDAQYVSGFGTRVDPFNRIPAFHAGIDLKQNPGAAILSTGNGIVVHAGPADGYGNMVEIAHSGGVSTRYGHMSRISVWVGQRISTGQILGTLGNTGRSTGAHLHYETRIHDQPVNPIPFLQMGERLRVLELPPGYNQL